MSDWIPIDEATLVCEMANKHKSETLLPMNIWIDENQTYIKCRHSKLVKFQLDHGNRINLSRFGTMDLDGNLHCKDIGELCQEDINALRNFVLNNKMALEHVADNDIWLGQIWPSIILGGEPASFEEIQKLNLKVDELIEYNNSLD